MRPVRRSVIVLMAALAACSGGRGSTGGSTTTTASPTDGVIIYDLLAEGRHSCSDAEGDVTVSVEAQSPPPVPVPGVDLLEAGVEIRDDEALVARFEVVGDVDAEGDPQYLVFLGLTGDPDGFELRVESEDGAWGVDVLRAQGTAGHRPIPTAVVTVDGHVVTMEIPMSEIPIITPNTPVNYGSTARLLGEDDEPIDAAGNPLADGAEPIRAMDDCLFQ